MRPHVLSARPFIVGVVLFFVILCQPLLADVTGTILGTVVDSSAAVVVGASVTLRNPDTGYIHSVKTDATGSFQFLSVPIGEGYVVEVENPGFEKMFQSDIKLLVNQSYRVDFHLQVGKVSEGVTVSATSVQVESTSTQLGDVIEDTKMTAVPLNGRSYIDLMGLQPGVVPIASGVTGGQPVSGNGNSGVLSINGNRESGNGFLVNGGDVEESMFSGASVVPTLDSIQEFRLIMGAFDAEYGRFSGGQVNVVTKSGTNAFHGDGYEFLRNEKLDARNFFDVSKVGEFRQNQFGGTIGGPILKNRLFFFSDYQGTRQIRGLTSGVIDVPSVAERAGDFSDVDTTGYPSLTGSVRGCDTAGGHCMNDVLTQRLGYTVTDGEPYWVPGCNSAANAASGMCVFPGEVIPQAAWSPAATGTLKFIPTPTGSISGTPYFSTSAFKYSLRDDKWATRIDFSNLKTGRWSIYYHFDDATVINPYGGGNVPGFGSVQPTRAQQINLSNTQSWAASVNEWRVNITRYALRQNHPESSPTSVSSYGFVAGGNGIIPAIANDEGVPRISLQDLGVNIGYPAYEDQFNNTLQLGDNYSKIVGKHTLKFGADFRYFQINDRYSGGAPNGAFTFFGGETGNDFADYLLGAPDEFTQASEGALDDRSKYVGIYAQDSYKVKSNLTINYGLRWEVSQPWADTQGREQEWKIGEQSKVYPDAPLGFVFPGDPGVPSTLAPTRYHNFAPRIGIAYSPGATDGIAAKIFGGPGKTSIRASYGVFYTAYEQVMNLYELGNPPFAIFYDSPTEEYLEEPYEGRRGFDPGQRFPYVFPPKGSTGFWAKFLPIGAPGTFRNDNVLPRTENTALTFQRQIQSSTILTVGYVLTEGHHLIMQVPFNPGNRALCLQVRAELGPTNGCGPFGEDTIYTLPNGQMVDGTRPLSVTSGRLLSQGLLDFSDIYSFASWGNSNYSALQASITRTVGSFSMLAGYTYSKSLDDSSAFQDAYTNPYDNRLSKSLSAFDMTNNFVVSYSYGLPLQKLSHMTSGPVHKLLDGWQLSGITRFTTGLPVLIYEPGDHSLDGAIYGFAVDMPNRDSQPIQTFDPRTSPNYQYFSTGAFSTPDLGSLGTSNRRFFHGPGINNWDMALHKTTNLTERTSIEFRAEFFNIFNHAQFNNPVGQFGAGNFGDVTSARDPRIGQMALKFNF